MRTTISAHCTVLDTCRFLNFKQTRVTEKGNYTEKDASSIIQQILEGVAYLHKQGEVQESWGLMHLHANQKRITTAGLKQATKY